MQAILVVNAGSSSLKFRIYGVAEDGLSQMVSGQLDGIGSRPRLRAKGEGYEPIDVAYEKTEVGDLPTAIGKVRDFLRTLQGFTLRAIGHRVVHGGPVFSKPVIIDPSVLDQLASYQDLAPLHQSNNLAPIRLVMDIDPTVPQIACFDTAFHHTQSEVATAFALPRRLAAEGVRRYGFHGLSYEYIASVLPDVLGPGAADGRIVVAHLGSGASLCGIHQRKSVATTMGFTALDGLVMSRRSGNLDPGVILYLMQEKGMTAAEVSDLLYDESGLLGVSGISDDMRTLLVSEEPSAKQAVALFAYRIGRELGSMAAALGGIDALVFTAGIGEHAVEIRRRACEHAAWLGVDINESANLTGGALITRTGSRTSAWVIPTDEDLMIARHAWTLLNPEATALDPH